MKTLAYLLCRELSSWRMFWFYRDKGLSGPFELEIMIPGTSWRVKGGAIPSPRRALHPPAAVVVELPSTVWCFSPKHADGGKFLLVTFSWEKI